MAAPHVAADYALGWDGAKEAGPIPGDPDGTDEGIIRGDHPTQRPHDLRVAAPSGRDRSGPKHDHRRKLRAG